MLTFVTSNFNVPAVTLLQQICRYSSQLISVRPTLVEVYNDFTT